MFPTITSWVAKQKQAWWTRQEAALREEFAPQLRQKQETMEQQLAAVQVKQRDLEQLQARLADQEALLMDRRVAVEKANEELRVQLRLVEAKAAPDRVWIEAFSHGYQMAWETVWPIMSQGVLNLKTLIEQKAIDETLTRLEPTIVERATALGNTHAREVHELLDKRSEFLGKQAVAVSKEDKARYEHYLTALDWMLDANNLHSHQPSAK